jgi:TolA-binding protein
LGICYLKTNLPDSAITKFAIVSPTSSLSQDASWYLGLCYLKAGNSQKATEVFKDITELQKHYKKEQAKEILELLSNMK